MYNAVICSIQPVDFVNIRQVSIGSIWKGFVILQTFFTQRLRDYYNIPINKQYCASTNIQSERKAIVSPHILALGLYGYCL